MALCGGPGPPASPPVRTATDRVGGSRRHTRIPVGDTSEMNDPWRISEWATSRSGSSRKHFPRACCWRGADSCGNPEVLGSDDSSGGPGGGCGCTCSCTCTCTCTSTSGGAHLDEQLVRLEEVELTVLRSPCGRRSAMWRRWVTGRSGRTGFGTARMSVADVSRGDGAACLTTESATSRSGSNRKRSPEESP